MHSHQEGGRGVEVAGYAIGTVVVQVVDQAVLRGPNHAHGVIHGHLFVIKQANIGEECNRRGEKNQYFTYPIHENKNKQPRK